MSISTAILAILLIIGCSAHGEFPRTPEAPSRHFRRSKEPRDNRGYIEQCRPTNLWREKLGYVNVFAFLDPSWYYSYRQAVMLELLKERLESSGFSSILFFVVTPPSDLAKDSMENNYEAKTWQEISMKSEYFVNTEGTLFDDPTRNRKRGIILVRDTPELGIWKNFRAFRDEVVIVDRCGKLTYQVIVPWSILYFPYVKGAILSTYKEDPCGPCDERTSSVHDTVDYEEYLLKNIRPDARGVDKSLESHTERSFASSEGTKNTENDKNPNTFVPLSTKLSTIADITVTETPTKETSTFYKHSEFDSTNRLNWSPSTESAKIEIASEIEEKIQVLDTISTTEDYGETHDRVALIEEANENDENSYSTINKINIVNTDEKGNDEDQRNKSDVSSKEKEKDNFSIDDHKIVNEGAAEKDARIQKFANLPLRIILYAPHLHRENQTLKKYTHLVLKTGNPDYHDHFNSKNTMSDQESVISRKSDTIELDDQRLTEYVHSMNESPGVYGEIADYWRTTDDDEFDNKNENTEFVDYDDATADDTESNINDTFDSESSILTTSDIDAIDSDTSIVNNDDSNEFMRRRLIEHYSKLLTWIYYIL